MVQLCLSLPPRPPPQQKIESLHCAVAAGSLREVQALLGRAKLALSKDENGTGLLHKAVYYNHRWGGW